MAKAERSPYRPQVHYYSPRLQARLLHIRSYRTTFVEAPSGAGKTTAVQDFFGGPDQDGNLVRWFVASEEPPTSGWRRLCRILGDIDPVAGERLLHLGFPVEENQGDVAQALLEIRCDRETYLICDNFQFLHPSLPASVWRALVDHGGKGLRLLVLTQLLSARGLPVLGNADVLRIDNRDLCLRAEEIGEYYRLAGVTLEEGQERSLLRYSEGWIVALYLQLVSYIRHGSFEEKSSIFELVDELFWEELSPQERRCLFRLSPFDNFTVPQACFLLGVETLPEGLVRRMDCGTLIRHDMANRRYFPHAILWDFVRSALTDEPEDFRREILHRAGAWCVLRGEKTRALIFFHRLEDYRSILSLDLHCADLSRAILDVGHGEMLSMLRVLVDHATPELRRDHAFTMISIAFEAFTLGDMELYRRVCGEMKEFLETCPLEEDRRRALQGELHLAASFGFYNDIEKMGQGHQRAYELLGNNSVLFRPDSPWTFGWPSVLGMYHSGIGRLDEEIRQMDHWVPRYNVLTSGNGSGAELVFRADALLHRGQDEEAAALAIRALDVTLRCDQDSLYLCAALLLLRIALLRGDGAAWKETSALLEACAHRSIYALSRRIADMASGLLAVLLDDPQGVPSWLRSGDFLKTLSPAVPFACAIYSRLLLLEGREQELLLRSEEFLSATRRYRSLVAEGSVTLCIAAALSRLDRLEEGVRTLRRGLDLLLPDGLILPLGEHADLLGATLGLALNGRWREKRKDVAVLSDRFSRGREVFLRGRQKEAMPPGLTEREDQIARLVLEGWGNRQIAQELFLSENTVKYHLKSLFRKLEVPTRRELRVLLLKDYPRDYPKGE